MKTSARIDPAAWEALRELQTPGEPDIIATFLKIYFESSEVLLKDLQQAMAEKNSKALVHISHSWKSSSYGIGAKTLGDLCSQLEKTALTSESGQSLLVAAMEREYLELKAELLSD